MVEMRLLSWTPAPTALLLRGSETFEGGGFIDERRLRERLQAFTGAGLVRSWTTAHSGGGLQNYYKLTPIGFGMTFGTDAQAPPRAFFAEVSPSLFTHTFRLAEVIVETLRACHARRVTIDHFDRNFLQMKIDPEWTIGGVDPVAKYLGIPAGNDAYVSFCTVARRDPDPGGNCPDCKKYLHGV